MARPVRHGDFHSERPPRFWIHGHRDLNMSWLRQCPAVVAALAGSRRERLSELFFYDHLLTHPQRTRNASRALLFFLPVLEFASTLAGHCEDTGHAQRMLRAASALSKIGWYRRRGGHDHLLVSNAGLDVGVPLATRLGPLHGLLKNAVVGRDRAYSRFYRTSSVGRCTLEVPYVSNPHARAARRAPDAPRRWLLHFSGSTVTCCEPGRSIRAAVAQLAEQRLARLER